MGTTGPAEIDPATDKPYALTFPMVTVRDMVRAQAMLLDALGIEKLLCVTGGSMGGMQALQWAALYPERVAGAMPIATAARHTAQNIALHEVGRQAIMADPDWRGGAYQAFGVQPSKGLAVARMEAHITYLSEAALERKFGRNCRTRQTLSFTFTPDFQVRSYLRHQGSTFVDRFDANSYLYITRAMDYFDLAADYGGVLADAFRGTKTKFQGVSFTSDWLFPTSENRRTADALKQAGADVSFTEIETDRGHDAFLLEEPGYSRSTRRFLNSLSSGRAESPRARTQERVVPLGTSDASELLARPVPSPWRNAPCPGDSSRHCNIRAPSFSPDARRRWRSSRGLRTLACRPGAGGGTVLVAAATARMSIRMLRQVRQWTRDRTRANDVCVTKRMTASGGSRFTAKRRAKKVGMQASAYGRAHAIRAA